MPLKILNKMQFVSEDVIMDIVERFGDNEKQFFKLQDKISNEQPALAALLTDENLDLLNDEEYELLWFVVVVIYASIEKVNGAILPCSLPAVEAMEELNWEKLGENNNIPFRGRLDVFYASTKQEDMLSFIEDSFESDEDLRISPASREVLFITAKTCMDALLDGVVG